MIVPLLLFAASLIGLYATLVVPALIDYAFLAGLIVLASLYLVLRAWSGRGRALRKTPRRKFKKTLRKTPRDVAKKWIVIDGSNVMHWKDNKPQIETVREVVERLTSLGYTPGVVFDANAGYLVAGKYQHHGSFGRLLGLPEDRVMVVNKGMPADPTVLLAARDLGARVVSNDRFRDWAEAHPEVYEPSHFIRGEYRSGKLWLDLGRADTQQDRKAKPAA